MSVTTYEVLSASEAAGLTALVAAAILAGKQPFGNPFPEGNGTNICQAVITGSPVVVAGAAVDVSNLDGILGANTPAAATVTTLAASGAISAAAALSVGTYLAESVGNALTAVGTNRATALQLAKQINRITTAASGTGVTLPTAAAAGIGAMIVVENAGANLAQVYGAGSDTIDGVAAATGVPLTNAKRALFIAVAAATWISAQLGVVSA